MKKKKNKETEEAKKRKKGGKKYRKDMEYFHLLEDAREIRELKEKIEELKEEELQHANKADYEKGKRISDSIQKKKRKRSILMDDFQEKCKKFKKEGKISKRELEKIRKTAYKKSSESSFLKKEHK